MARDGLLALLCAGCVIAAAPRGLIPPALGEERNGAIAATLAVQTALQQGREQLLQGNPRAAVYVLESQLAHINGSREGGGYCRLRQVGEQLNRPAPGAGVPELEKEVRQAMSLSPKLKGFGQVLLNEIAERRTTREAPRGEEAGPEVAVRHLGPQA